MLAEKDNENLLKLATLANRLHNEQNGDAWQIGEILNKVKTLLSKTKSWQKWVEENCDFCLSTARYYKRIYDRFTNREELIDKIPTTLLTVMAKEKFPQNAADIIFDHPGLWERGMVQIITKIYRAFKRDGKQVIRAIQNLFPGKTRPLRSIKS